RVLAMTASALVADRNACLAAGMDGFLSKPVLIRELQAALRSVAPEMAALPPLTLTPTPTPVPALPGELPLLDPAYLDRLRQLEEATGRSVVAEVVDNFLGEAPRRLAQMRDVLAAGDGAALDFAAHSLKGIGAQLGALRLAALSRALEVAARGGALDGAAEIL